VRGLLRAVLRGIRDVAADPDFGAQLVVRRAENAQLEVERERLEMALEQNVLTPYVRQHGLGGVDPVRWGQALDQLASVQPFKDRTRAADSFTDAYLPAKEDRLF
jgi:NitT/TauT family transport system substrate-binding protein